MDQSELRGLLLGPQFNPKVEDIATPPMLLAQGVPEGILRLVSMSAAERSAVYGSFSKDASVFNSALLVTACLRMRDSGGDDGRGTPVFSAVDAQALVGQDASLIDALAADIVKPFLGVGGAQELVDAAKNDSGATQQSQDTAPSSTGGSASPTASDAIPSENASPASATVTS